MTHSRTPAQSSYLRQSAADLLRWPLLGRFLRWRHSRTTVQTVFLILSAVLIFDGLTGPSLAPKNLATVTSWIQYRGFLVLSLLVIGNLFCFACPFMLPRRLGKWLQNRFLAGGRPLPRALRSKWLALVILTLYFFTYERWDLWASPWLTAWLILAYFAVAFVVDTLFQGAAFCKYVCPVGQFNFFGSLVSPSEVKVRDAAVCVTCTTKDCIRGRPLAGSAKRKVQSAEHRVQSAEYKVQSAEYKVQSAEYKVQSAEGDAASSGRRASTESRNNCSLPKGRSVAARGRRATEVATTSRTPIALFDHVQPGCELNLFQPVKVGNQDCTFCLDCVHACPHDNVGWLLRIPTAELWTDPWRSGVGRFSQRLDLAALLVMLTFGGFMNAFGMIRPVYGVIAWLTQWPLLHSVTAVLILLYGLGLIVLPALMTTLAGLASRAWSRDAAPLRTVIAHFAPTLVPTGFGMWLAHYLFHFLTGGLTLIPTLQDALRRWGWPVLGEPLWQLGPVIPPDLLFPIEVAVLYLGLTGSLVVGFQRASLRFSDRRRALRAFLPWAFLCLLLVAAGVWILAQPMEMRGMLRK
ncbi:MAG: FesM [Anaerolineae bacterium]|uniref:FesM n=1 Tax=Candidatus Amarolinea dominans TaxID=3140696 RepID=UPI0031359815|nr:FesM [Anaerolineae bacterium]